MAQITSGKVLREARERKGYDLNTVARRLRIRPDILRAIEAGDFSAMPPRGYTRNMVNAYARLLGLNPTEIVNMYLDEAYANQVERARGSAPSSGFNMDRASSRSRSRTSSATSGNRSYETNRSSTFKSDTTQTTRVLYDDGTRFARDDYGVTRERAERPGVSDRDFLSHHSGYDTSNFSFLDEQSTGRGTGRNIYLGQTPNSWPVSRFPAFMQSRVFIVVAVAVILALVVGVAFAVAGVGKADPKDDVAELPVSGVADTTGGSDSSSSTPVELAPSSARVIYSVPSGKECYVETYQDGKMTPEMLTGPAERSLEVTGVWVITTYDNEALKLTVDGQEVKLKVDSQYNDMYAYTVDFPAILKKWNSDHGISNSSTRSATTTSSTGSTNTNGTTNATTQQGETRQTYEQSVNYDDTVNLEENQARPEDEQTDEEQSEDEEEEPAYTEEYDESQGEDQEGAEEGEEEE